MRDVIYEMSRKGLGMTCVRRRRRAGWSGIITDGDLRRHMSTMADIMERTAARRHDHAARSRFPARCWPWKR